MTKLNLNSNKENSTMPVLTEETNFFASDLSEELQLEFDGYVRWLKENKPDEYWKEKEKMHDIKMDRAYHNLQIAIDTLNDALDEAGYYDFIVRMNLNNYKIKYKIIYPQAIQNMSYRRLFLGGHFKALINRLTSYRIFK